MIYIKLIVQNKRTIEVEFILNNKFDLYFLVRKLIKCRSPPPLFNSKKELNGGRMNEKIFKNKKRINRYIYYF